MSYKKGMGDNHLSEDEAFSLLISCFASPNKSDPLDANASINCTANRSVGEVSICHLSSK